MITEEKRKRGRQPLKRPNACITLTINNELHERLAKYAKEEERSISFITKKAIEMYLESKGK
tara:strand:+ start:251 stop:436 length:186 start_codon:yes stop_codon:yes gene_type:complete